jgi:hypothetical protein
MKEYRLLGWPDLPAAYHRTAYRRMLHEMSQRHASVVQLMHASGLARTTVKDFVDLLSEHGVLDERGAAEPDSLFGSLMPLSWIRRARNDAGPS